MPVSSHYDVESSVKIVSDRIHRDIITHIILQFTSFHIFVTFLITIIFINKDRNIITYSWLLWMVNQMIKCTFFELKTVFYDHYTSNFIKYVSVSYMEFITITIFANFLFFYFGINYFYFYKNSTTILDKLKYIAPTQFIFTLVGIVVLLSFHHDAGKVAVILYIITATSLHLFGYYKIKHIVQQKFNQYYGYYMLGFVGSIVLLSTYAGLTILYYILAFAGQNEVANYTTLIAPFTASIAYVFITFGIIVMSKVYTIYNENNKYNSVNLKASDLPTFKE